MKALLILFISVALAASGCTAPLYNRQQANRHGGYGGYSQAGHDRRDTRREERREERYERRDRRY